MLERADLEVQMSDSRTINEMFLEETAPLMISADYKDRFKAEYLQLAIRYNKLSKMVENWDKLNFTPTCDKGIYQFQLKAMRTYMDILEYRAELEGVEL